MSCKLCAAHYRDAGVCDEGKPVNSPHRRENGSGVVLRHGVLDAHVCVPQGWTDEQVVAFINDAYPSGSAAGWQIVRAGSKWLGGDPERQPCVSLRDKVHILLEC